MVGSQLQCINCVSTHAPARGATHVALAAAALHDVSTHAPARGATRIFSRALTAAPRFNPRAREGRDLRLAPSDRRMHCFNPRAREGRDTPPSCLPCRTFWFQPTRPRGARLPTSGLQSWHGLFQPTRPRGARLLSAHGVMRGVLVSTHAPARGATPSPSRRAASCARFNPRAREGRDRDRRLHVRDLRPVSTHAPARGATAAAARGHIGAVVSTHAPARGATLQGRDHGGNRGVSTHAPARGATSALSGGTAETGFQPTRPRGARRQQGGNAPIYLGFNPRAREGRDP